MFRAGFGMLANYIIGSIGVVILTIIGIGFVDYTRQSMVAGVSPAEFGLSGWTQSFVTRGKEAARRARITAERDGPMNGCFPASVSGWQRFDWNEGFDVLLDAPDRATPEWEREFMADLESNSTFAALKALDNAAGSARDLGKGRSIAVYMKGDKIVMLKARMLPSKSSFMGNIAAQVSGQAFSGRRKLVKAYSGVGFYQTSESENKSGGITRRLRATVGEEIEISVKTNARVSEIDSVLRRIRYRDLLALVDVPEDAAESKQTDLTASLREEEQRIKRKLAEERRTLDRRLESAKRRARIAGEAEACIDTSFGRQCVWVD